MSDDELEKLAAAMKDISPSKAARKGGMAAAMAAFDMEFAADTTTEKVSVSEENLATAQGFEGAARPTGQSIGGGSVQAFGRYAMNSLNKIFNMTPKTAMMGGSCMAAFIAAFVVYQSVPGDRFIIPDAPSKSAVTAEVTPDVAAPRVTEVDEIVVTAKKAEADSVSPSIVETPKDISEVIIEPEAISETSEPIFDMGEIETGISPKPLSEPVSEPVAELASIKTAEAIATLPKAAPALPSDTVVITRRVVKTPARTQERIVPNVGKTTTRRILKKAGIPTGRMLPPLTKEVSRRVVKTPAATSERIIPAITQEVSGRVQQADGSLKTVTATVVLQEASTELVDTPPTYETVTETVVVLPERAEYEPGTAEYETVSETVVVQEASTELVTIPATYETVTETIKIGADGSTTVINSVTTSKPSATVKSKSEITPVSDVLISSGVRSVVARGEGESRGGEFRSAPAPVSSVDEVIVTSSGTSADSYRPRGKDTVSRTAAVASMPSATTAGVTSALKAGGKVNTNTVGKFTIFNGVSNQVVQSTETTVSQTGEILCRVMIPARYKTITKQVVVEPARTVEREIPAVTKDITVRVKTEDGSYKDVIRTFVVKEAWTDIDVIPAVYETRSERILVAPAREEWKPGSQAINAAALLTPVVPPKPKPKPKPVPQSGLLTAGDYDDVLNPDLYKVYLDKMLQGPLKRKDLPYVDANERVSIRVVDTLGKPVPLADISLRSARGKKMFPLRTGADGMAYLYPNYDSLESGIRVKVSAKGARSVTTRLTRKLIENGGDIVVDLKMETAPVQALDLLLTIDATGSMGDEIRYLQSELKSIISRVEQAHPGIDVHTGLIVYRDVGDDYVIREIPFTGDIEDFQASLAEQNARGGGDKPEAMHSAMQAGLEMEWRKHALKVNLLVADAPPHDRHLAETWDAGLISRTKGIHIVPLAASGVDKTAEFVMRSMAQITGGRFLFLTDDSGIGNKHAKPTVDCYVVSRLDGLVTRVLSSLIKGERVEPEASDVIRSVGNYRAGTCAINEKDIPASLQTVSYKYKQ